MHLSGDRLSRTHLSFSPFGAECAPQVFVFDRLAFRMRSFYAGPRTRNVDWLVECRVLTATAFSVLFRYLNGWSDVVQEYVTDKTDKQTIVSLRLRQKFTRSCIKENNAQMHNNVGRRKQQVQQQQRNQLNAIATRMHLARLTKNKSCAWIWIYDILLRRLLFVYTVLLFSVVCLLLGHCYFFFPFIRYGVL